jgi:hypothetical protein
MSALANWVALGLAGLSQQGRPTDTHPALYEYILVGVSVVVLVWVFYLAVRVTVRPGEEQEDHIKRRILEEGETNLND